jgi:hypothetical protein
LKEEKEPKSRCFLLLVSPWFRKKGNVSGRHRHQKILLENISVTVILGCWKHALNEAESLSVVEKCSERGI